MRMSTADAAKQKTTSILEDHWRPTAPRAPRRPPTNCGCSCTRELTGSCGAFGFRCRSVRCGVWLSSTPCGCVLSKSLRGSSNENDDPRASAHIVPCAAYFPPRARANPAARHPALRHVTHGGVTPPDQRTVPNQPANKCESQRWSITGEGKPCPPDDSYTAAQCSNRIFSPRRLAS